MGKLLVVYALLAKLKLISAIISFFFVDKKIQLTSLVARVKLSSLNNREDKYLFMIDDSMR